MPLEVKFPTWKAGRISPTPTSKSRWLLFELTVVKAVGVYYLLVLQSYLCCTQKVVQLLSVEMCLRRLYVHTPSSEFQRKWNTAQHLVYLYTCILMFLYHFICATSNACTLNVHVAHVPLTFFNKW